MDDRQSDTVPPDAGSDVAGIGNQAGEAATGPGEVRSDPVVKKRSHKKPPKHKGRPVLKEEEFAVLMERLGPCPVKGSLEDVKRWMAEKTVLTILNRANRDAVLLAQAILKTNTGSLPGMPAPEAKPESAGSKADAPVQRRREE